MSSYKPNQGMKAAANRALEWRKKYGRGGTAVGVARARDIKNGAELSESTVKRMHSFLVGMATIRPSTTPRKCLTVDRLPGEWRGISGAGTRVHLGRKVLLTD